MSLRPDILILQECSEKDITNTDAYFKHWVGSNPRQGMAIIGFANYKYTIDSSSTQEWPWFLPLCVEDVPLHILGLWACEKYKSLRYVRVIHQAIDHYAQFLSMPQMIVMGDFNSNAIWDRDNPEHSHSLLVAKLKSLGLVSAYHTLRDELQGQEAISTFFMQRNRDKLYHIDYAFVPQALSKSCELLIGEPSEWLLKSDHMPLILTFSI